MHEEVSTLTGKLQLETSEPARPAGRPLKYTVLLPVTNVPALSGTSFGASIVPGGIGAWERPRTSMATAAAGSR